VKRSQITELFIGLTENPAWDFACGLPSISAAEKLRSDTGASLTHPPAFVNAFGFLNVLSIPEHFRI